MSGKFIVFEGIDGSGKSTQAELLKEYLEEKGIKVWLTKEPTDGQTGQLLQKIQKGAFKDYFTDPAEFRKFMTYLYAADRVGHDQQIDQHLQNGEWVICDRYKYSTYAYNKMRLVSYEVFEHFGTADLPLFIKIPVDQALDRIHTRGKTEEIFENKKYLEGVNSNYEILVDDDKLIEIDGTGAAEEVFGRIKKVVDNFIEENV